MKLSVVMPVYNEIATIERVVEAVESYAVANVEIVVVDDYSQDGTRDLLQQWIEPRGHTLVYHDRN